MKIVNLKCEFLDNPIAIDNRTPRFSWVISSEEYNVVQTSYRIVIASERQNLDENKYDIWDSGIISSDECIGITYAGIKLKSKATYWWKVICKTNTENVLVSNTADFGMGMLICFQCCPITAATRLHTNFCSMIPILPGDIV